FTTVTFSPDGRTVAAADRAYAVHLWAADDGKILHRMPGHDDTIDTVAFTGDGKTLLVIGYRETRLWDVATGKKLATPPGKRFPTGNCAAFSPDGKLLAIGDNDYRIQLFDWATG